MTDLRPYTPSLKPPLTAGARFIRGFKRIGIVLGGIALVGGFAITIPIAVGQQNSAESRYEQAICMNDRVRNNWPIKMKSYDQTKIDFDATGCPSGPFYYESLPTVLSYAKVKPAPLEYAIEPFAYGAAASIVSAAILFYGFWLIGWLCAGFTRD
ncbi:hypothetical protein ACRQ5Q_13685 [Bradyrhizobium sp. PMVTL-01]|uniref:hypothetical protein n=1 Tax=Bradyrhizobium sp. PMVTL-01 TaxID=3434999 RepID=UPI003F6FCC1E